MYPILCERPDANKMPQERAENVDRHKSAGTRVSAVRQSAARNDPDAR